MMKHFRSSLFLILTGALVSLLVTGCGRHNREDLPPDTLPATRDPGTVMVTVAPVTFQQVQRTVEADGTLFGYEEVTLSTKVEGRVRALHHDVQDRVKPGEALLEIDPTDYQLSVNQAESALEVELAKLGLTEVPPPRFDVTEVPTVVDARIKKENLKLQLDRVEKLARQHAISEEEWTDKTAQYRSSEADYETQLFTARSGLAAIKMKQEAVVMARQQLTETVVHAPAPTQPIPEAHNGVAYAITRRAVSEGTFVRPGDEVFRLVIEHPLKLRVPVPERHAAEVRLDQEVQVSTEAYRHLFPGKVTRINPAVDPVTRTFEVEILVPNAQGELKPGGFAKATILTRLDKSAATVPLEALVNFAGITKIFLVENSQAREVQVTPGVQTTAWVEITRPVRPDGTAVTIPSAGQVVTSGQTALADGTSVAIQTK